MAASRTKVLFFAEGATLAHVGRPFELARGLAPDAFEVVFARPPGYGWLTDRAGFRIADLACQDSAVFVQRLDRGLPLYDFPTLLRYVADDLALIDRERPDVVVGDFRLSLSISARLRAVPCVTVCDAYWSPERPLVPKLPVMAWTPYVPLAVAEPLFRAVAPLAFRLHARPMERLRAHFGLPGLGHDLRLCYTDADLRLFANPPALFPDVRPGPRAAFIGPVAWSPPDRDDLDWLEDADGPLAYVTMGSSGDPKVLAVVIPILERLGCRVAVASAGKPLPPGLGSARTWVYDYLPGDQLCRHADLVVCNGGSPTTNQALRHGVPVLGIARNMDQFLNLAAIEGYGAGRMLRADRVGRGVVEAALTALLGDGAIKARAQSLAVADAGGAAARRLAESLRTLRR